jgi:Terminase RNaseH-like domain
MSIPANINYAEAWAKKQAAQINELKAQLEETHSRETGKPPQNDRGEDQAGGPVILTRRERREKKRQEEGEAERQKLANAEPPVILHTTAGYELVLPSKDLPVTREQLEEWGKHLYETVAADSPVWKGETALRASIEYFLKIRPKNKRVEPVQLNRVQREVDRNAGTRNIVLKARQVGITTYVAARFFLHTLLQPGTLSVQVAHDQQSAEEIFRIVHRFLENLPEAWRPSALKTSRANVRQIIFPKLDSEYRVESAADRCAGRGLTIQNLHCSEVARWPHDVDETLAALRAAVPPDGEIFLESTPSGAGGTFYEEWQAAPETGYVRHFFPWWWEDSYQREVEIVTFTEEEIELMMKKGLNAAQIAFRREMRSQFRNRFPEEYAEDAETCFLTSGNCMFDCAVIDGRLKEPREYCDERENGRMLYFFPPVTGKRYIIGVDPAGGGVHGDNACAQVIEVEKGTQCAELLGRYTPQELAAKVTVLAKKYNMALVAVERNNQGEAVLAFLGMESNYPHLYPESERQGWLTNASTRPPMLSRLEVMLANTPQLFHSHRLLQECRSFVRDAQGRCAAAPGAHDDTVMAMAIAQAARAECRVTLPVEQKEAA